MEIKPNELRIGNFVKWGVHECIIKGIHTDTVTGKDPYVYGSVMIGAMPIYTIEGIELTPEWLEKFGFHGIDDDGLWGILDNDGEYIFQLHTNYLESENSFSHIWDSAFTGAPVEHVHQLQNLYFALTGKELAIDNKSL